MRAVEREFGLQQLRSSIEAPRHAATQGEIEAALHTGIASTPWRLQQLCDAAIGCGGSTEFAQRLDAAGVAVLPVMQLNDTKMSGLSYRFDGVPPSRQRGRRRRHGASETRDGAAPLPACRDRGTVIAALKPRGVR